MDDNDDAREYRRIDNDFFLIRMRVEDLPGSDKPLDYLQQIEQWADAIISALDQIEVWPHEGNEPPGDA